MAKGNRESKKPKKERSKQSLQRRVKRALQWVGSRRSDQARRNRNKRSAEVGRFLVCTG
jgi:two-component sensor histidine kinase